MLFVYQDTLELMRNATLDDRNDVVSVIENHGTVIDTGVSEDGSHFYIHFNVEAEDPWDLLSILYEIAEEIMDVCRLDPNKEKVKEVDAT